MAEALKTLFSDIAVSIREKTGKDDTMKPIEFSTAISNISVSSEGVGNIYFVTFMTEDGKTELYKRPVLEGDDCPDPIEKGKLETPKKSSTQQYDFTYSGWSLKSESNASIAALKKITSNRTVYTAFKSIVREYTIKFYDGKTLIKTEKIPYGGSSEYIFNKVGAYFQKWEPEPINITGDMDCYGVWEYASFATDSWYTIREIVRRGEAEDYYKIGDTREASFTMDGEVNNVILRIVGFNRDYQVNENESTMTIIATTPLKNPIAFSTTKIPENTTLTDPAYYLNQKGYFGSDIDNYLSNVYKAFISSEKCNIWPVSKKFNYPYIPYSGLQTHSTVFHFWIPSIREVAGDAPYRDQVSGSYYGDIYHKTKEEIEAEGGDILYDSSGNGPWKKRIKTPYGETQPVSWWLRDVDYSECYIVKPDGSIDTTAPNEANAHIVFGFCIG